MRGNANDPIEARTPPYHKHHQPLYKCTYMHVRNIATRGGVEAHRGGKMTRRFTMRHHNLPACLLARVLAPLRAALPRPPTTGTNASACGSSMLPQSKQVSKRASGMPSNKAAFHYRKKKEQEGKKDPAENQPTILASHHSSQSTCGCHLAVTLQESNCVPETLCFGATPPLPSSSPLAARRVQKVSPTSKQMPLGY